MALSLKNDSFTSLGNFNKKVLSDDYTHSCFETYKFKGVTAQGSKLEYKAKVKTQKQENITYEVEDEGKLQFSLCDRFTVELAQRRKGDLRFHLDLGNWNVRGKQWNFFTNLKTNTKLESQHLRFGANYFGSKCESNTRLNLAFNGQCNLGLVHRNFVRKNNFVFAWVLGLDLCNWKQGLNKYDAIVGYESGQCDLYLQHNSKCPYRFQCGKLTTTATYNVNDKTQVSLEVESDKTNLLTAGFKQELNNDLVVRGKINTHKQLSFAVRKNLKNITFASSVQLNLGHNLFRHDQFPQVPFGVKFDVKV